LKFTHSYIAAQNTGTSQAQLVKGGDILRKLDDQSVYLPPGTLGYYEIPLSFLDTLAAVSQLQVVISGATANFPSFEMERGKLYSFSVGGGEIAAPAVSDLDPVK
jgi:hypothetical protein